MQPSPQATEISIQVWLWNNAAYEHRTADLFRVLSDVEITRRDRQHVPEKGLHWAISRGLVRQKLAEITGTAPRDLQFQENEYGQPKLVGHDLSFSISHDGAWTALAVCETGAVGVDIESLQPLSQEEMAWPLSPVERAHLAQVAPDDVPQAFFRYWTLKEAFIKALGLGVSFPLHDFDMSPFGEAPGLLRVKGDPDAVKTWRFEAREVRPNLRLALAVKTGCAIPKFTYHEKYDT